MVPRKVGAQGWVQSGYQGGCTSTDPGLAQCTGTDPGLAQCTSPSLAQCTSPSLAWLCVLVLAWPGLGTGPGWAWLCVLVLAGPGLVAGRAGGVSGRAWLGVVSGASGIDAELKRLYTVRSQPMGI